MLPLLSCCEGPFSSAEDDLRRDDREEIFLEESLDIGEESSVSILIDVDNCCVVSVVSICYCREVQER